MSTSSSSLPVDPHSVNYFHGRISRQDAERLLSEDGRDGLFLLRWCISHVNGYAVSVIYHHRVHHYAIDCHPDGMVSIEGRKKFSGPIELIDYHRKKKKGMVTRLTLPCIRPPHLEAPYFWFGVTTEDFHSVIEREAIEQNRDVDPDDLARQIHAEQPWFHGVIRREEAERRLTASGHDDGKFLVREKSDGSYALSLSHRGVIWHYVIEHRPTHSGRRKLKIENGPLFDNMMDLITYYHCGGLYCTLSTPCARPDFRPKISPVFEDYLDSNPLYGQAKEPIRQRQQFTQAPADNGYYLHPGSDSSSSCYTNVEHPVMSSIQSQSSFPSNSSYLSLRDSRSDADSDTYYVLRQHLEHNIFDVRRDQLILTDQLGSGQFGSVKRARYQVGSNSFVVAVKMLKADVNKDPSSKKTLMKEAGIMSELDNPYIIRMIGLCRSDSMLILEYAPLGPLNDYLRNFRETPMQSVLELLQQVAKGMAYLESKSVVHRDLAARNVLLLNQQHAKISDFGLSRDMATNANGKDYYQSSRPKEEKWPIKWYAPECLKFGKFDSRSDVWSYGVTMWEATSYALTPFKGLDQNEYRRAIERGTRMKKPQGCPPSVYGLMLHCWAQEKEDRPTFAQIVKRFSRMTFMEENDDVTDDVIDDDTFAKQLD